MQTFVLSPQPTGFFVLNDIFRYINEEGEEEPEAPVVEEGTPGPLVEDVEMPKALPSAPEANEAEVEVADKKLEKVAELEQAAEVAPATNGNGVEAAANVETDDAPIEGKQVEEVLTPEVAEKAVEDELKAPEQPKEPVSSPALTRVPSSVPASAASAPAMPAKPLSWASRVAATAGVASAPKPAVPAVPKTATAPAQARPLTVTQAPKSAPGPASAAATKATPAATSDKDSEPANAGWQTAGDQAKRQNRNQSISGPVEKDAGTMGYVRYVTDKVGTEELKAVLAVHGDLVYFDINRAKVSF